MQPLVLIVEDNPVIRRITELQLGRFNLRVHAATNGKEAVQLVEHHDYTLILMDISMPVMDGFEATRLIRQSKRNRSTPIVAISASNTRDECLRLGMDDYIQKPADFSSILRKWLPQHVAA